MQKDSIFNISCNLWTKVELPCIQNVIGKLSHWQNSSTLRRWRCPGSREVQSRACIKFIKIPPVQLIPCLFQDSLTWATRKEWGLRPNK
jgi:hypothetical protein